MKKIAVLAMFFCAWTMSFAQLQKKAENVVQDFGYILNQWCQTNDPKYRDNIVDMCVEGFRVSDQIATEKAQFQGKYHDLNSYLKIFGDIRSNKTKITFSNIKKININNCRTKEDKQLQPIYVEIGIKSPQWNYMVSDVFYVKNGKIVYIGDNDGEICQDCTCEVPFSIADVSSLSFEDEYGKEVNGLKTCTYGKLKCKIFIKSSKKTESGDYYISIIRPDNTICNLNHSEYTLHREKQKIAEGAKWYNENIIVPPSYLTIPGRYKITFYNEQSSITRYFDILPQDRLDINKVEFVGLDKNGNQVTDLVQEGGTLSSPKKIKGIKINLYYTKLSEDVNIIVAFDCDNRRLENYDIKQGNYVLEKGTTQDNINIMYNGMPRNTNITISLTIPRDRKTNIEKKTYTYKVKINN